MAHRVLITKLQTRQSPPSHRLTDSLPAGRKSEQLMPPRNHDPFKSIDLDQLSQVSGGASRVTSRTSSSGTDQLTLMMTQITDSLKSLSQNNNQSDPMQMIMMMMMMGGMGGGSSASAAAPAPAPAPAPQAPVINISTTVKRHGW